MTTKTNLKALAKVLHERLATRDDISLNGRFYVDDNVGANKGTSIAVDLGKIFQSKIHIEVWFDGETGWAGRKFWCGFVTTDKIEIEMLIRIGKPIWGVRREFVDLDAPGSKHPRVKSDFGRIPIWEGHRGATGWQFLGIYESATPTPSSKRMQTIATRISSIAQQVAREIGKRETSLVAAIGDKRLGKDKKVLAHARPELWIRDSTAARSAKKAAKYICAICGEQLGTKYGSDIGKDYAEAHHKIPLSTLKGIKEKEILPKHLICVCANCHRMLHRLIAKGTDGPKAIADLSKRVHEKRKAGYWTPAVKVR